MKIEKRLSLCFKLLLVLILLLGACNSVYHIRSDEREFYQLKVYNFTTSSQEQRLDNYLENALLPALDRKGTDRVGVFKPVEGEKDYGRKIYVLIPFKSLDDFAQLDHILEQDQQYLNAGSDYIEAPFDNPPYDRIESFLMRSFAYMPVLKAPDHSTPPEERIYEMRSYEAATEDLYKRKVHMFNEGGEIAIFEKLNFNAVFYGEVLSGSTMPNLIYMTTFPDRATRDEYWEIFRADPDWEDLKVVDYYANTVSKNTIYFLYPTDYSGI